MHTVHEIAEHDLEFDDIEHIRFYFYTFLGQEFKLRPDTLNYGHIGTLSQGGTLLKQTQLILNSVNT